MKNKYYYRIAQSDENIINWFIKVKKWKQFNILKLENKLLLENWSNWIITFFKKVSFKFYKENLKYNEKEENLNIK